LARGGLPATVVGGLPAAIIAGALPAPVVILPAAVVTDEGEQFAGALPGAGIAGAVPAMVVGEGELFPGVLPAMVVPGVLPATVIPGVLPATVVPSEGNQKAVASTVPPQSIELQERQELLLPSEGRNIHFVE
jgi:hypothetical protein